MHHKQPSLQLSTTCLAVVLLLFQTPGVLAAAGSPAVAAEDSSIKMEAAAWPQADRLFRSDPRWLGGDGASSVDLGGGRVLWMFGDSFVAARAGASRRQAEFIRNSTALQTGYDPSQATIRFYSGQRLGKPADFAPSEGSTWLWPLNGIRMGNRLLLFYNRVASDSDKHSLGFQSVGWNAFMVDNPDAEPSKWTLRKLAGPEMSGRMLIGMSVIRVGGSVYAFVLDDRSHDAYLLRWPIHEAEGGRLSSPQWWGGAREGWQPNPEHPQIVIWKAGSEFSVQPDPHGGFLEVNSAGFGASTIVLRRAANLEGPWSEPQTLYRPPESDAPDAFVYGGKAHPELSGADLIVTYAANGSDERLATDMTIYFPRFVRVTFNADSMHGPHTASP